MKVIKQGTRCLLTIEAFQRDGMDIWGINQQESFHLGSYQSEEDAVKVLTCLFQAELQGQEPFQMPSDFKLNRRLN